MEKNIIGEAGGETLIQAHVTGTPYTPRGRSKHFPRATSGSRREGYFHLSTSGKEYRILDALDGDRWRLEWTSATLLTLVGLGDDQAGGSAGFVTLDGLVHRWTTNPTVTNGGLAASTTYNVYALISGGAVTLEVVATAPAPAAQYEKYSRKTADGTRVLVGVVRTNAAAEFQQQRVKSVRHEHRYDSIPIWLERDPDTGPSDVLENKINMFELPDDSLKGVIGSCVLPEYIDLDLAGINPTFDYSFSVLNIGLLDSNILMRLRVRYLDVGDLTSKAFDETLAHAVAVTNTDKRRHFDSFTLDRTKMVPNCHVVFVLERQGDDILTDLFLGSIGLFNEARLAFRR